MNRTILAVAGAASASSLLLVDSVVKGAALLLLALIAALILRRDSAATRHLVWLLAMVALLVVPILSALLPQWRVLPEWAGISPEPVVVATNPPSITRPTHGAVEMPQDEDPVDVERPSATAYQPAAEPPDSQPALVTSEGTPAPAAGNWGWIKALPLVWAIGFSVLILRLLAARWMLWNTERQATVIREAHDPIVIGLEAASSQLGLSRPVTLLVHPDKMIPVVWGIFRCQLLLPAATRNWSAAQLRSVLLHELAHIKRHDMMVQMLTQIACALHWFNPLVWFAAWRLGVERERACDDLVLAGGVRPSAYAGHLLDVVTGLAPARWSQSCGLAMARKSSLEGRLLAVLSGGRNRRGVTRILAAAAVVLAAAVAIPLAMLHATQRDQPKTETTTMKDEPKDAKSRPLFEDWKTSARTDGKIPGGRIGEMAASLKTFMDLNPTPRATGHLPKPRRCSTRSLRLRRAPNGRCAPLPSARFIPANRSLTNSPRLRGASPRRMACAPHGCWSRAPGRRRSTA
jgi:bla regulator protein BlaR1